MEHRYILRSAPNDLHSRCQASPWMTASLTNSTHLTAVSFFLVKQGLWEQGCPRALLAKLLLGAPALLSLLSSQIVWLRLPNSMDCGKPSVQQKVYKKHYRVWEWISKVSRHALPYRAPPSSTNSFHPQPRAPPIFHPQPHPHPSFRPRKCLPRLAPPRHYRLNENPSILSICIIRFLVKIPPRPPRLRR